MKTIILFPFYLLFYFFYWIFKLAFLCIHYSTSLIKYIIQLIINRRFPSISQIDKMDGYEFEHFSKQLLEKDGFYDLTVTRSSGDQGIDILGKLNKKAIGVQCKNYSGSVGNKAVQEAIAGAVYYGLEQVYVLTNSYFTGSAKYLAQKSGVILLDRDYLLKILRRYSSEKESLTHQTHINTYSSKIVWDNESFSRLPIDDQMFLVWNEMKDYSSESPISYLQTKFRIDYMTAATLYDKYLEDPENNHLTID